MITVVTVRDAFVGKLQVAPRHIVVNVFGVIAPKNEFTTPGVFNIERPVGVFDIRDVVPGKTFVHLPVVIFSGR